MNRTPPLIGHLETFCGPIVEGWPCDPDGKSMPFQIVRLQGGPARDTIAYSSLGLSNIPMKSRVSDKLIRHELVMLSRSQAVPKNLPALLQQVAGEAVKRRSPYLRGDVIGPRGPLFGSSTVTALYVSMPVYFPDQFCSCETETIGTVIFAWLVPITELEASFVRERGWERFEDELVDNEPDLIDFGRKSIV